MSVELRDYQLISVERLRKGLREGHRCQVLCAPTGAGKTVVGAHLLREVQQKSRKGAFLVDRVALVCQTSERLWEYGIQHGIAQGENTTGRNEPIQVCSAQTIEKRGYFPDMDLLIVDECHTQRRFVTEFIQESQIPVIGLSATPFTRGLGKVYSNVVNVTTTNELVEQVYLAPLKVYAAIEPDMTGAKVVAGEWTGKAVEERAAVIVGDIVSTWVEKTTQHFGGRVKTIAFSATVAHGEELCRQFQAAGYRFEQVSYRDGNDEIRAALIEEFRKPDSDIVGLVSCEALAKGFDVPDILCGIGARPYRKSVAAHIQQIGRAMRSHPGKDFALWLDHAGNYLRFFGEMEYLFEHGVDQLDDGEHEWHSSSTRRVLEHPACLGCGFILGRDIDICPSCGKERPKRKNRVANVPGEMVEVIGRAAVKPYLEDPHIAWGGICLDAIVRKDGDIEAARKFALAQYRNFYSEWPRWGFEPADAIDPRLRSHIKANVIRYVKGKRRNAA